MPADEFFRRALARIESENLRRALRPIDGPQSARLVVDERSVISLCSNNYLGLADHPALIEAAARAARDHGVGAGASRLVSGSMRLHHELEERLAAFKGAEAALLFNSGYHANLGTITALVRAGDHVFSDELNHASLIDGCRLSRARIHVYRHRDIAHLEELLAESSRERDSSPADAGLRTGDGRRLIVTDSIFSMDGDTAPLREICELAERFDAMVMVDEAHATGVVGSRGAGLVDALGLEARVTVQMGTLGKAFGCFGAYIAGSRPMVNYVLNTARTFIFTTALPPPVVAAAGAALTIVEREPERRERLRARARRLRAGLRATGYDVYGEDDCPIVPVLVGDAAATMRLSAALLERGVLAQGIRPPTVPAGTARIRATVMATHSEADLDEALRAFADCHGQASGAAPGADRAPESRPSEPPERTPDPVSPRR